MADNINSHVYDWDDVIENDSSFTPLPAGVYPFTVTGFERGRYDGGKQKLPACPMAILTVEIDGGQLGKRTINHRLYLHSSCEGLLCAFFTSAGLRKHGERLAMPWDKVVGSHGWCNVGIHKWKSDRTGDDMESNEIKRFLPPENAPTQTATPAATQSSGWTPGAF